MIRVARSETILFYPRRDSLQNDVDNNDFQKLRNFLRQARMLWIFNKIQTEKWRRHHCRRVTNGAFAKFSSTAYGVSIPFQKNNENPSIASGVVFTTFPTDTFFVKNGSNRVLSLVMWRKIKNPKDKLIRASHTGIKLTVNIHRRPLKCVHQKDNVKILYNNAMYCYTNVDT